MLKYAVAYERKLSAAGDDLLTWKFLLAMYRFASPPVAGLVLDASNIPELWGALHALRAVDCGRHLHDALETLIETIERDEKITLNYEGKTNEPKGEAARPAIAASGGHTDDAPRPDGRGNPAAS